MDRRELLKYMAASPLAATGLLTGADALAADPEGLLSAPPEFANGRTPEEQTRDAELAKQKFLTEAELKTVTVLAELIIPADEKSGGATQAGVPAFIEFMAKDQPHLQTPLRGGLRWLDNQANKQFGKAFTLCAPGQQTTLLDQIAYPEQAKPEMKPGVAFFSLMRNLTASGYFSSQVGHQYLGYQGNRPNVWDGVPQEVLAKFGLKYDPIYDKK
jgi:gluconate 2-dehydrogenase gamma chain